MNCKINVKTDNLPKAVSTLLEDNSGKKILSKVIKMSGEEIKASPDFINWCKDNGFPEPDFNVTADNRVKALVERAKKFYGITDGDSSLTVREEYINPKISKYGYTSSAAREDAKQSAITLVLNLHRTSLHNKDRNNDANAVDRALRAKLIAYDIINKSKLTETEKINCTNEINIAKTEEQVRRVLAMFKLKSRFDVYGKNKSYYGRQLKSALLEILKRRCLPGKENVLITAINTSDDKLLLECLDDSKFTTEQNKNLIALFNEAARTTFINKNDPNDVIGLAKARTLSPEEFSNYVQDTSFFDEILKNSKLEFLRMEDSEFNDGNEILAVNAVENEESQDEESYENPTDDDVDITIGLYEHMGTYKSAMVHCSKDIKNYLNSLPVLTTNNIVDEDLSNAVGLPLSMNSNFCATMLYHWTDKSSPEKFLNSIKELAKKPGCGGFAVLVDNLEKDYNTLCLFYSTFGKVIIPKTEVRQDGNSRTAKRSNMKSIKLDCYRQELLNCLRSNLPLIDVDIIRNELNDIKTKLRSNIQTVSIINGIANSLTNVIKQFYTNVTVDEVIHFTNYYNPTGTTISRTDNLKTLFNVVNSIATAAEESLYNYNQMMNKVAEAYNHNKAEQQVVLPDYTPKLINISSLYSDFISQNSKNHTMSLANLLVDHAVIKVENNSVSPLGNQSSDVINSNYLTGMMKILNDKQLLAKYGRHKFRSKQYQYSNILLNRNNRGVVNKFTLFKQTAMGSIIPTEYADKLLSIQMYNGAKNYNEDEGLTYAMHSAGDYIAAAFTMFYNPSIANIKERGYDTMDITFGEYLMRTPADAQHNFTITAPRYNSDNLLSITNEEVIVENTNAKMSQIMGKIAKKGSFKSRSTHITTYNINQLFSHLTSDKFTLRLTKQYEHASIVTVPVIYTIHDENSPYNGKTINYEVTGRVDNNQLVYDATDANHRVTLYTNELNKNTSNKTDNQLSREDTINYLTPEVEKLVTRELEKAGKITYNVDTNDPIMLQLKDSLKQEILDMAVALDFLFETDKDGLVLTSNNTFCFKHGEKHEDLTISEPDGRKISGAYDNYHFKTWTDDKGVKHGKIIKKDDNDNNIYRLTGNVFHSSKFTVWEGDKTVNYGEKAIEELFGNLLYGGADGKFIHVVKDENGKVSDITLNPEQEEVIDKHLSDYVLSLIRDASERLYNFENFINIELTANTIADFILNYQLMYDNFNDLFEGDDKFYKDSRTFLKRAKEVQGSGVPYGIANFLDTFDDVRKELTNSPLALTTFANDTRITPYNKFVGVTVVNTVTSDDKTLQLIKDKLMDKAYANLSEAAADAIVDGHKNATVNDAQSYITFEEWVRRVTARGQLEKYRPLINKVIKEEPLCADEINEFIQVQKNFYYNQDIDHDSNIFAPNQIKNAEFVLVPQLIRGTQLELVARIMNECGIDQLNTEETSKAGKTNTLTIFDPQTGRISQDIIDYYTKENAPEPEFKRMVTNEFVTSKKLYSYEYLYTQQETPQHMNATNKAGIQIMKKILDNITPSDGELWNLKTEFIDAYCNNIKYSANKLFNELGLEVDDNGNIVLNKNNSVDNFNFKVFYDKLRDELFRLGYDSNMVDYVTLDEFQVMKNGDITLMPNYMTMVSQKLENIAQSVFNNSITRQKLPGFHAAQITNVGLTPYAEGKENIHISKDLKYHKNDKGEFVDYIEIKLPKSAFNFKRRTKDGTLKDDDTLLKELQAEGLDTIIGYRIPTEGKQSICKMKIVGFVDDAFGSTIVVPNEWVSQTGSDFDIDSVYGIQHDTYIDKEGHIRKYSPNDKSHHSTTNKVVECMLDILGHPKCLEENVSQSNFRGITGAISNISKTGKSSLTAKRRNDRSVFNILDQCAYQEDAMSGAKLKGFSVTRDNFCSICNTVQPTVSSNNSLTVEYNPKSVDDINVLQKRYGEDNVTETNDGKIRIRHNKFGWSNDNKNILGQILTTYSSQTTAHILDNIKEGSVPNVNDYTFGVFKLFPDLGIDYTTGISFMMQNGVSRIIKAYNSSKSIFINDYSIPIESAIREIAKELGCNVSDYTPVERVLSEINNKYNKEFSLKQAYVFSADKQIKALSKTLDTETDIQEALFNDLNVIIAFNKLKSLADEIGSIARVCNPDKFGAKQSIFATNKVFDNIYELLENESPALTVNSNHILNAIYPNIDNGDTIDEKIANYIKSSGDSSKYKVLDTFLRYSTAPSIIINRKLFKTQGATFRNFINNFNSYLNNGRELNEKQYKLIERYIIGELYTKCGSLVKPITYMKKNTKNVWVGVGTNNELDDIFEEISRIFGYRNQAEPTREIVVTEENDKKELVEVTKEIDFYVSNKQDPTQEDIDAFAKLTPAQKVNFIQTNFKNPGICKYLQANLYNVKTINNKITGTQTIDFIEDSIHVEDAYNQMISDFTNKNPLIALTAYDIIKYAFIVEGYKMTKRGVSKIIPNQLLYTQRGISGIGLVEEMNSKFRDLMNSMNKGNNDIYLDFIRSNYKSLNIPLKTVNKDKNGRFKLKRNSAGIITIIDSADNQDILDEFKLRYDNGATGKKKKYYPNSTIRLKFDKTETLYKIVYKSSDLYNGTNSTPDMYILYPLNKLEPTEHGLYSINPDNNSKKYPNYNYYKEYIDLYLKNYHIGDAESIQNTMNEQLKVDDYMQNVTRFASKKVKNVINLEDNNTVTQHLNDLIVNVYKHEENRTNQVSSYTMHNGIGEFIKRSGYNNGQTLNKSFTVIEDNKAKDITMRFQLYKMTNKELRDIEKHLKVDENGKYPDIKPTYKRLKYIIEELRKDPNITNLLRKEKNKDGIEVSVPIVNVYRISVIQPPVNDDIMFSAVTEGRVTEAMDVAGDIYKTVLTSVSTNKDDLDAINTQRFWKNNDITYDNANLFDIIRSGAEYISNRTQHILNELKTFYKVDDIYYALNTPTAVDALYNNDELRNKYLQLMLETKALVRKNQSIAQINVDSQDSDLQSYLTIIQRCIKQLKDSEIIGEAQILFANRHLAKYSTDPLIQHDVIKVLNGFHETNWFDGWFGDMTETSNNMMQIITKVVTSDIHSKQKLATNLVKDVKKKIAELKKEAATKGHTIDWAHIIDETGRFIQNYDNKLKEDRDKLRDEAEDAKLAYVNGNGTFENYYVKKLAYDKWKAEHINQIADRDYYNRKVALESEILFGKKYTAAQLNEDPTLVPTPGYKEVFLRYKELSFKRGEIYSHMTNGYLDDAYVEELDKINKEVSNLISIGHIDPVTGEHKPFREEYDPYFNPITGNEEQKRLRRMYSAPSQRAITQYIEQSKKLEDEYFKRDTEFGFDEELAKHLKVINYYEKRDPNGNISVPLGLLMDHPDYVASKQWIAHNAQFVIKDEESDKINEARKKLSTPTSRIKFKELVKKRDARTEDGTIDGRVFTDDEIAEIRREQEGNILLHENASYCERGLLKNAKPSTTIYKREFYSRMKVQGTDNVEYQKLIGLINTLLMPYWNSSTKVIEFYNIPVGEVDCSKFNALRNNSRYTELFNKLNLQDITTGTELYQTLEILYEELSQTKKRKNVDKENAKAVAQFIADEVDMSVDKDSQDEFNRQSLIAESKGKQYAMLWRKVNVMINENGEPIPNPYIYSSIKPINEEKYIDKEKTEAMNLISSTYMTVPTEYYYMKTREMSKLGKEAYNKWFYDNHIFNPSTGELEPIRCWTTYTYKDTSKVKGEYTPKWINTRRTVKNNKKNKHYIENAGHLLNYIVGTGYDNPAIAAQNTSEQEFKAYIQELLYSLVHTDDGRQYLQQGYFPAQYVGKNSTKKTIANEVLKTLGWFAYHDGQERYHDEISYDADKTIRMPLLQLMDQIDPTDAKLIKPVREENETDEAFLARERKYREDLQKLKENNLKAHGAAINHNWEEVLEHFILEACRFNAIQDNKYMLLYGLDTISQMEVYTHKRGGLSDYKKDKLNSTEDNPKYQTRKMDNKLYEQVENWIRRILYDEWKEPRGALTKWASRLQSLTSAQYMMMNLKGGIANVSLGSTNILSEAFAREYIGEKAWAKGIGMWHASVMGQLARFDSDTAINEADAIIKWFCVVDYDQQIGKDNKLENPTMRGFRYFNSFMYSPQTIGENYMHNSVLLGMLDDHRIIKEEGPDGKIIPVFKTLNDFIRDNDRIALLSILNDKQKEEFNDKVKTIQHDANILKDYIWRRNDVVKDYVDKLNDEDKKKYIKARKQLNKDAEVRFKANPTVLSELKLGSDGYMTFKDGGILAEYNSDYKPGVVTPTLRALSDFRNKVISVNKKIHGSYDKLGQAQIEKKWWGSLLMQYHKHIYPGMLKRWRVKGMYNEHRGSIEKGSYVSLAQFLSTPIKDIIRKNNLTEGEAQAVTGIQAIFRKIVDFILHYQTYWNLLPEYDKANIKRVNGDMAAVLIGIIGAMMLRGIGDDDKEDSIWYNLALYEVDRLSSEAIQFNPLGMFGEAKKLWSTPIAAQSGVEDLISSMGFITSWLFDDEFNPIYQTGRFAGQNKLLVRIKRRIPIYRGIYTSLFDIKESNRYYKLSENMLGNRIVEDILDWTEEEW